MTHDAWILAPFFQAGGRITAGDVHFVENPGTKGFASPGQENVSSILTPAGETEFARDAAFGYKSSNLVDWLREKAAGFGASVSDDNADGSRVEERVKSVVSVSLEDLRKGGPAAVRARLREAQGGCVIVNSVDQRDLQVRTGSTRWFIAQREPGYDCCWWRTLGSRCFARRRIDVQDCGKVDFFVRLNPNEYTATTKNIEGRTGLMDRG